MPQVTKSEKINKAGGFWLVPGSTSSIISLIRHRNWLLRGMMLIIYKMFERWKTSLILERCFFFFVIFLAWRQHLCALSLDPGQFLKLPWAHYDSLYGHLSFTSFPTASSLFLALSLPFSLWGNIRRQVQGHWTGTGLRAKGVGFWSQLDWPRRDLVFSPVKWEYPLPSQGTERLTGYNEWQLPSCCYVVIKSGLTLL